MIRRLAFNDQYWNYYIMLEEKFAAAIQYVELTPDNYETYSNEFANQLITIGSEIDVLFKLNCGFDLCGKDKNISDYARILCDDVIDIEVEMIPRQMATIKPFSGWDYDKAKQSLFWWEAFDEIKHNRSEKFYNASLKNVLWSLCALFVLENLMLKRIAEEYKCVNVPGSYSCLFRMKDWEYNATILNKYIEEDLEQFARDIGINDDDLFLPEE